jgi:hypothetical protein
MKINNRHLLQYFILPLILGGVFVHIADIYTEQTLYPLNSLFSAALHALIFWIPLYIKPKSSNFQLEWCFLQILPWRFFALLLLLGLQRYFEWLDGIFWVFAMLFSHSLFQFSEILYIFKVRKSNG